MLAKEEEMKLLIKLKDAWKKVQRKELILKTI